MGIHDGIKLQSNQRNNIIKKIKHMGTPLSHISTYFVSLSLRSKLQDPGKPQGKITISYSLLSKIQ